jgi:hypothetical protein
VPSNGTRKPEDFQPIDQVHAGRPAHFRINALTGAYAVSDKWAATFKDFRAVQKPNSFTIDQALAMQAEATPERSKSKPKSTPRPRCEQSRIAALF